MLELLTATAVSLVLVGLLLQIFGLGGSQMQASAAASDQARQARPALDWLAGDLGAREAGEGTELIRPGGWDGELLFLARDPRAGEEGSICLLRYYTAVTDAQDRPAAGAEGQRRLYRQRVSPAETLELVMEAGEARAAEGGVSAGEDAGGAAAAGEELTIKPLAWDADALPAPDPLRDDRVADRVGALRVRGWHDRGAGLEEAGEGLLLPGGLLEVELGLVSAEEAAKIGRQNGWGQPLEEAQLQWLRLRVGQAE